MTESETPAGGHLGPADGMAVLHLFYRVDRARAVDLPAGAGKDLAQVLQAWTGRLQLHPFSVMGHKADLMLMALSADLGELRALQTAVETSQAGPALDLDYSYVSLTEASEYTTTPAQYRSEMAAKGVDGADLDRRVEEFAERMRDYNQNKLYPDMPAWELACFYPMSHRREGEDNWYRLGFEQRKALMAEHGRSGRAYTGRVLQLVTGSTGLDDWEWGVTLFAHDLGDLKDIVYRLRYDEASARFAEFGPFVIGLRRAPDDLVAEIGLPATG